MVLEFVFTLWYSYKFIYLYSFDKIITTTYTNWQALNSVSVGFFSARVFFSGKKTIAPSSRKNVHLQSICEMKSLSWYLLIFVLFLHHFVYFFHLSLSSLSPIYKLNFHRKKAIRHDSWLLLCFFLLCSMIQLASNMIIIIT